MISKSKPGIFIDLACMSRTLLSWRGIDSIVITNFPKMPRGKLKQQIHLMNQPIDDNTRILNKRGSYDGDRHEY